jgi:hypothetical protein
MPGHFVSPELRADCARFLEDVKNLVAHRSEKRTPPGDWKSPADNR